MAWGNVFLVWGLCLALAGGGLVAGDLPDAVTAPGAAVSLRRNASVSIGGELATDYTYRYSKTTRTAPNAPYRPTDHDTDGLAVRRANLRVQADVHPNVRALFKIDFSANDAIRDDQERLLEEALLVMSSVGGTGLGFFAGKSRAPYGQDITLGIIQSYHHMANQDDSSEGPLFIRQPWERPAIGSDDPADAVTPLPAMRPGQFDRVFMAGASYEWDDCWRVEVAAFQPTDLEYKDRLRPGASHDNGAAVGAAGRLWWRPFEDLVLEVSGMVARSSAMARVADRTDVSPLATGRSIAYAVSVGFDWHRGPWQVFGEYQRGQDWNFTKGYHTDTWQLGAAYHPTDALRFGVMAEGLRIEESIPEPATERFFKLAFTVRYAFTDNLFVLAEYGREWQWRSFGKETERGRGDFFGIRVGFVF
ncbi:MAG: hypothetical protein LIQ31_05135 [Planctomycetes bacterium]|nr:hypothetical protein [Planctomycetota bacterium]